MKTKTDTKRQKCIIFSRNNGYLQPIDNWNAGKHAEWEKRVTFEKPVKE